MLEQIGQAMLTDFAALTGIAAILVLTGLLTRKKREQTPRAFVLLRRALVTFAAVGCMLAPRFGSEITPAHGMMLALFILAAELGSWP